MIPTSFCISVIATFLSLPSADMTKWSRSLGFITCEDVTLAAIESGFRPDVVHKGANAKGLMQITPVAIIELERTEDRLPKYCKNAARRNLLDPLDNLTVGHCYFTYLKVVMKYNNTEAFVAYNGGNVAVKRLRRFKTLNGETANYLVKYLLLKRHYELAYYVEPRK